MEKTTITTYLKGWLRSENMDNDNYLDHWKQNAINVENDNFELVIFKIPKLNQSLIITEIVELIQKHHIIDETTNDLKNEIDKFKI